MMALSDGVILVVEFVCDSKIWETMSLSDVQARGVELAASLKDFTDSYLLKATCSQLPAGSTVHKLRVSIARYLLTRMKQNLTNLQTEQVRPKETEWKCPIGGRLVVDPVSLHQTGLVYDRSNLERYFRRCQQKDTPMLCYASQQRLTDTSFSPVVSVRNNILRYVNSVTKSAVQLAPYVLNLTSVLLGSVFEQHLPLMQKLGFDDLFGPNTAESSRAVREVMDEPFLKMCAGCLNVLSTALASVASYTKHGADDLLDAVQFHEKASVLEWARKSVLPKLKKSEEEEEGEEEEEEEESVVVMTVLKIRERVKILLEEQQRYWDAALFILERIVRPGIAFGVLRPTGKKWSVSKHYSDAIRLLVAAHRQEDRDGAAAGEGEGSKKVRIRERLCFVCTEWTTFLTAKKRLQDAARVTRHFLKIEFLNGHKEEIQVKRLLAEAEERVGKNLIASKLFAEVANLKRRRGSPSDPQLRKEVLFLLRKSIELNPENHSAKDLLRELDPEAFPGEIEEEGEEEEEEEENARHQPELAPALALPTLPLDASLVGVGVAQVSDDGGVRKKAFELLDRKDYEGFLQSTYDPTASLLTDIRTSALVHCYSKLAEEMHEISGTIQEARTEVQDCLKQLKGQMDATVKAHEVAQVSLEQGIRIQMRGLNSTGRDLTQRVNVAERRLSKVEMLVQRAATEIVEVETPRIGQSVEHPHPISLCGFNFVLALLAAASSHGSVTVQLTCEDPRTARGQLVVAIVNPGAPSVTKEQIVDLELPVHNFEGFGYLSTQTCRVKVTLKLLPLEADEASG